MSQSLAIILANIDRTKPLRESRSAEITSQATKIPRKMRNCTVVGVVID